MLLSRRGGRQAHSEEHGTTMPCQRVEAGHTLHAQARTCDGPHYAARSLGTAHTLPPSLSRARKFTPSCRDPPALQQSGQPLSRSFGTPPAPRRTHRNGLSHGPRRLPRRPCGCFQRRTLAACVVQVGLARHPPSTPRWGTLIIVSRTPSLAAVGEMLGAVERDDVALTAQIDSDWGDVPERRQVDQTTSSLQ